MTSYGFYKIAAAAAAAQYYFQFRIFWCQQTQFRIHISIHGWEIITSSLEKQTSAILEFYFWFRSRPVRRNLLVIMHHPTEFRLNRSSHCGNITSYRFIKMAAATAECYFRFCISWCHCLQKVSLLANQILSRYLKWRLRYNYFRFRNTNVRHIGILLPVSISTISP